MQTGQQGTQLPATAANIHCMLSTIDDTCRFDYTSCENLLHRPRSSRLIIRIRTINYRIIRSHACNHGTRVRRGTNLSRLCRVRIGPNTTPPAGIDALHNRHADIHHLNLTVLNHFITFSSIMPAFTNDVQLIHMQLTSVSVYFLFIKST